MAAESHSPIKTVDIKSDRPSVDQALLRLDREIFLARQQDLGLLKVIHGYGSSGVGGDIRIAVEKHLRQLMDSGQIRDSIRGENWTTSDEASWKILKARPDLKADPHLGRRNRGITLIVL
jgi:hypothetical protein